MSLSMMRFATASGRMPSSRSPPRSSPGGRSSRRPGARRRRRPCGRASTLPAPARRTARSSRAASSALSARRSARLCALRIRQRLLERRALLRVQRVGEVGDARLERRDVCRPRDERVEEPREGERPPPPDKGGVSEANGGFDLRKPKTPRSQASLPPLSGGQRRSLFAGRAEIDRWRLWRSLSRRPRR